MSTDLFGEPVVATSDQPAMIEIRPGIREAALGAQLNRHGHRVGPRAPDDEGLSERERAFVDRYLEAALLGEKISLAQAYREAFPERVATVSVGVAQILRRPHVQRAMIETAAAIIAVNGPEAAAELGRLARHADSENVRMVASMTTLKLAGLDPGTKLEISGEVTVGGLREALEQGLASLAARRSARWAGGEGSRPSDGVASAALEVAEPRRRFLDQPAGSPYNGDYDKSTISEGDKPL